MFLNLLLSLLLLFHSAAAGTVALTQSAPAVSVSAVERFSATAASSQVAPVVSATARERVTGTSAVIQSAGVLAATGTERLTGTAALAQAVEAIAASGKSRFVSSGSTVQAAGLLASAGRELFSASASSVQATATFTDIAGERFIGTAATTQAAGSIAGDGSGGAGITGTAQIVQPAPAINATGGPVMFTGGAFHVRGAFSPPVRHRITAKVSSTQAVHAISSIGVSRISGASNTVQPPVAIASAGRYMPRRIAGKSAVAISAPELKSEGKYKLYISGASTLQAPRNESKGRGRLDLTPIIRLEDEEVLAFIDKLAA